MCGGVVGVACVAYNRNATRFVLCAEEVYSTSSYCDVSIAFGLADWHVVKCTQHPYCISGRSELFTRYSHCRLCFRVFDSYASNLRV